MGLIFQVVLIDKPTSQNMPNIPDSPAEAFPRSFFGRSSVRSLFVTGKFRIKVQTACFVPGVRAQVITECFSSDPSFFLTVRYLFAPFLEESRTRHFRNKQTSHVHLMIFDNNSCKITFSLFSNKTSLLKSSKQCPK